MEKKQKIVSIVLGLAFLVFLGLAVFINRPWGNKTNPESKATDPAETPAVPSGVTIEGTKDKVREPGVYRRGPLRFINGKYVRIEGEFIPWKKLEKQGIMIVKQGELSTPEAGEEEIPENFVSVKNIDGIVVLPEHITSIANGTFAYCNITEIHLPDGLKQIGYNAFIECKELKEIYIPDNVKKIQGAPFAGCDSLTQIRVSGKNRWYDSRKNCNAIIQTDINRLIAGCKNTVIPSDIESIEEYAYENWINRESINLPIAHQEDQ